MKGYTKSILFGIIIITLLLGASACCKNSGRNNPKTNSVDLFVPSDSKQLYFPARAFMDSSDSKNYMNQWISKVLFQLREPVLCMDKSDKEIYRFVWLRTFHNPIVIRFERNKTYCKISWKVFDGASGYDLGNLSEHKTKIVRIDKWLKFQHIIDDGHFFETPSKDPNGRGCDGSSWILEAKTNEGYHVAERWTPSGQDVISLCCHSLLELTDLKISQRDFY